MDFKIEFNLKLYENFVSRDLAVSNEEANSLYFKRSPLFDSSEDIMKKFVEQKLKDLESKMEQSMERKINKIFKLKEKCLENKISSLKAQTEELKNHQESVKIQLDQCFQALEILINGNVTERDQALEKNSEEQKSNLQAVPLKLKHVDTENLEERLKLLELTLGRKMEFSTQNIYNRMNLQAEEIKTDNVLYVNSLITEMRGNNHLMDSHIKALDWKVEKLATDIERLREDYFRLQEVWDNTFDEKLRDAIRMQNARCYNLESVTKEHSGKLKDLEIRIQTQIESQEEQIALRETELKLREEKLDGKVEEMMKMMKLAIQNKTSSDSETSDLQITGPDQDNPVDTIMNAAILEITDNIETKLLRSQNDLPDTADNLETGVPRIVPTDDPERSPSQATAADSMSQEDEENAFNESIRQMEEEFQRNLATQNRSNEEKLRMIREQREANNRKAEEEKEAFLKRYGSLRSKK